MADADIVHDSADIGRSTAERAELVTTMVRRRSWSPRVGKPHVIQAINAEFLAERKFFTFILFEAVTMSLMSALLLVFVLNSNGAQEAAGAAAY